jgi:HAE1 family hydrophobic/amphiphilic exporter-1
MSTMTSVFGMLPLVLVGGAGSELYRGIGSVLVGGLVVSTVFTLLLVPTMFSLVLDVREAVLRMLGRAADRPAPAPARGVIPTTTRQD